ncbi:putative leucine-rich repeat-containing protein DDB_G0290503 isoform X2 [Cephus cinctus]|uniref:Leucine-rich repeat-containing protein DDB_G0290503 isoform X2 n=1 Tax=Cephus cinctus TaxID=211228 RepID=A0AAJ7BYT3_CEPCN|nr:putative leucine-rich repeat-containing protein DDB_G0290503 isoform X2 [Cephus cinctus]
MSIAAPRFQCIEMTGKALKVHPGKPSLSATMQKSKIPTNINQPGRAGLLQTDSVDQLTADSRNTNANLTTVKRRLRSHSAFNENFAKSRSQPSTAAISVAQKRLLENDYTTKKKKYAILRKELVDKQKITQELYESINRLREKVISLGSKDPGKIEELPQVNQVPAKKGQTPGISENVENCQNRVEILTQEFIKDLETSFQQIPESLLSICQEALAKRTEIISWLTDFGQENTELNLDPEIAKQLSQYKLENAELELRYEEVKRSQNEFASRTKVLLSEIERLKNQDRLTQDQLKVLRLKMDEIMAELLEERERSNQVKEKKTNMETQLQKAKNRIKELEVQVTSNENHLSQLQNQTRQKETGNEQRAREMQRSLKSSDGLVAQLEKQRESLESRLIELKKDIDNKQAEINEMAEKFEQKIDNVNKDLDEQKKLQQETEVALNEAQERCRQLEKKYEEMCELAKKSKELNVSDGEHKENETRLRNELESLRGTLTEKDEKLERLNREKEEIIAVMHQAANEDNEATREKLTAKLAMKTNELQALRAENAALRRRQELVQERNSGSINQMAEVNRKSSHENGKALSNQTMEVQQQIADLRNALSETVRKNGELQKVLAKKEIELEKRDKDLKEQSKILRVRDEVIGLIKGADQRSNGNNINELRDVLDGNNRDMAQVNKQIAAKAEQLRELFSTLEYKQMQIRQLETMVRQMDEQQERAQAQRTRLENRIAQLELALMGRNKERSKGFSFA